MSMHFTLNLEPNKEKSSKCKLVCRCTFNKHILPDIRRGDHILFYNYIEWINTHLIITIFLDNLAQQLLFDKIKWKGYKHLTFLSFLLTNVDSFAPCLFIRKKLGGVGHADQIEYAQSNV